MAKASQVQPHVPCIHIDAPVRGRGSCVLVLTEGAHVVRPDHQAIGVAHARVHMGHEATARSRVRPVVPYVRRDAGPRDVGLAVNPFLKGEGELAPPGPDRHMLAHAVDACDKRRAVASLVVLAGRAVAKREGAQQSLHVNLLAQGRQNAEENVRDA